MDNDDEVNKNKKFITSGLHETRQKQQPIHRKCKFEEAIDFQTTCSYTSQ